MMYAWLTVQFLFALVFASVLGTDTDVLWLFYAVAMFAVAADEMKPKRA